MNWRNARNPVIDHGETNSNKIADYSAVTGARLSGPAPHDARLDQSHKGEHRN